MSEKRYYLVSWDGHEYGSGWPTFAVTKHDHRGDDSEGRAASYRRWFDSRETAEAHRDEKNGRSRRLLSEYLSA